MHGESEACDNGNDDVADKDAPAGGQGDLPEPGQ